MSAKKRLRYTLVYLMGLCKMTDNTIFTTRLNNDI